MMRTSTKSVGLAVAGFCYGFVLAVLGTMAAGAGHGTYVFLGLASSPFGITQKLDNAFAAPFFWCVVGGLLGAVTHRIPRALFLAAIFAHYTALPFILASGSMFGDWDYVHKVGGLATFLFGLYGLGQVVTWWIFVGILQRRGQRLGVKDLLLTLAFFIPLFLVPELIVLGNFRAQRDKQYDFAIEEPAHTRAVRQVKTLTVKNLPKYEERARDNYHDVECGVGPGPTFHWVHPHDPAGELITWNPTLGDEVLREPISEPPGVDPMSDGSFSFRSPVLWVGPQGDQFLRWEIGGNGDHGLAFRKSGSGPFTTTRSKLYLRKSKVIADPEGTPHLLVFDGMPPDKFEVSIFSVSPQLQFTELGSRRLAGYHDFDVLDAAFVDKSHLHLVWASVEPGITPTVRTNWMTMRTIDYDLQRHSWSGEREIWRLDRFVGSAHPSVHILGDGSTHYLWHVDEGEHKSSASGLFYQAKQTGQTIKLADAHEGFKALVVKDQIIVCYSLKSEVDKIYFRVIRGGNPGLATSITLGHRPYHALWSDSMVLGSDAGDKFWFIATHDAGTLYLLEVADGK
jgi:hypothetical protein